MIIAITAPRIDLIGYGTATLIAVCVCPSGNSNAKTSAFAVPGG